MVTVTNKDFDLTIKKQKIEKGMELIILPRIKISQYHTGHTLRAFLNTFLILFSDYDLLHVFVFPVHPMAIPAVLAKLIRRKPLVIDGDDLWRGGWANYHPWLIKKQLELSEDKLGFIADKITVVGEKMEKRFLEAGIGKEKIAIIPNGASVEEIKPLEQKIAREKLGLDEVNPFVLVMGHTFTEGLFLLLKAFNQVVKRNPKTKLLFLGKMALSQEDELKLKNTVGEIKQESIIFLGEKPFSDVQLYLAAADVLVLPMDDNPIEEARFPMRLGDYLCSGRPVASNAVGEVKRILLKYQCGLVSAPKDIDEFSHNILKILEDKKLSLKLGKSARTTAENILAWSRLALNLEKIYEGVLRKK